MKIIDAHHHFWDPANNYHPWLCDEPMIPFRYGNYAAIRRRFMPEDYDQEARNWNIVASVTMEGEWNPADPVGESEWMQSLADRASCPAAHAAQAWLDRADLPSVLQQLAQLPIVRSVRHKPRANNMPGGNAGGMAEPAFVAGYKQLAEYGLHFELQTPWWHLPEVIPLTDSSPDTLVIINHAGLPSDRSEGGLRGWRNALKKVARREQTVIKISGLGLADRPWSIADNHQIILEIIEIFGAERCMFASNFPVDKLCGSFDTIWSGFEKATRSLNMSERDALFHNTANRVYRLGL